MIEISIDLPEYLITECYKVAQKLQISYSEFICKAINSELNNLRKPMCSDAKKRHFRIMKKQP